MIRAELAQVAYTGAYNPIHLLYRGTTFRPEDDRDPTEEEEARFDDNRGRYREERTSASALGGGR